jgi:hypothetical protein
MTLKEKSEELFLQFRTANLSTWINDADAKKMSVITADYADEFSIGFAEWTHNLRNACEKDNAECNKWENISNKELLKIYKKEKGL